MSSLGWGDRPLKVDTGVPWMPSRSVSLEAAVAASKVKNPLCGSHRHMFWSILSLKAQISHTPLPNPDGLLSYHLGSR